MVAAPRTLRLWVRGSGSGRLSTMRLITIVEVMRWTPGKVASFWSCAARKLDHVVDLPVSPARLVR